MLGRPTNITGNWFLFVIGFFSFFCCGYGGDGCIPRKIIIFPFFIHGLIGAVGE